MCDCDCHKSGTVCACCEPKPRPALRVGQKVQLTGTIASADGNPSVVIDGDFTEDRRRCFPPSALTPVAEPEPQWTIGDVVRIGSGVYLLTDVPGSPTSMGPIWCCAHRNVTNLYPHQISAEWRAGRVKVLHKEPSDG